MSRKSPLVSLILVVALLFVACGSDDTTDITTSEGDGLSQPSDSDGDGDEPADAEPVDAEPADAQPANDGAPIPVEPDGGIGDGAEPLPGAEGPPATGSWHGAEVAETNCPGNEWKRVQASAFSFSVPSDFVESDVQGIDSEVGVWTGGDTIEVSYDYGWYSGSLSNTSGAENEPIDYSGIAGEQTIVRDVSSSQVGVYFGEVAVIDGQADKLGLIVSFADPKDEIIGRCIVGSIDWTAP